jgi:1,4-dihydroxy-2-naphthoate octaprenyltransferase
MNRVAAFFGIIRLPFLLLTPVCVFLGLGMAVYASKTIDIVYALLAFAGALCAHVSVNAANEYFDFRSGLDEKTMKTPFSGGSGTL